MTDYGDEKEPDTPEEEFAIPEPPARGTRGWHRVVLGICATENHDDYRAALEPVWQWRGWRLGVDVMTEVLCSLNKAIPAGHEYRDGFGQLRMDALLALYSEEARLSRAVDLAQEYQGPMPQHEFLAQSVAGSYQFGEILQTALPVWQEAVTAMGPPAYDQEAGAAVITRYLNSTGQRAAQSRLLCLMLHGTLRSLAFPRGNGWVEPALERARPSGLESSEAVFQRGHRATDHLMEKLAATWQQRTPASSPRRGEREKPCANCGDYHRR